jgi:uncharacterized membrane protein YhhN
MKQLTLLLIILYWAAVVASCYYFIYPVEDYAYLVKSLTMPFLLAAFLFQCRESKHKTSRTILSFALFFAFLGDLLKLQSAGAQLGEIISMASSSTFSIFSVFCYLLTLFIYIFFFFRLTPFKSAKRPFIIITCFFILLYLFFFLSQIMDQVINEGLLIPFIFRAIVIGALLFAASNTINGGRIRKLAYTYFIPGVILYVISDTFNVIWLYHKHTVATDIVVLLTYTTGQFLIVRGAMRFLRK